MKKHTAVYSIAALLVLISAFFIACSDSAPQLNSVTAVVVFEFSDATSAPKSRLSVFTEATDIQRVKELRAVHEESGLEWNISSPRKISGKDAKTWAGYTNLVAASGSTIPLGKYDITYVDDADRESESSFFINYPSSFTTAKSADFPAAFTNGYLENVALYTIDGTLLYYGKRKNNWNTNSAILQEFQIADTMRICYSSLSGAVVCMMPSQKMTQTKTQSETENGN